MYLSFPAEIISIILFNLGKYDLLNSRLVSTDWNQASLKILQKSKYRQKLVHASEVKKYVEFAIQSPQFVLPFQIKTFLDLNMTEFTALGGQVEKLIEMFGKECTPNLSVKMYSGSDGQAQINALILLFAQLSEGLEKLDLHTISQISNPTILENTLAENPKFLLPKLKKFSLNSTTRGTMNLPFWMPLIEKCPNLKILRITNNDSRIEDNSLSPNNLSISQIESLKLHNFSKQLILQHFLQPPAQHVLQNLELNVNLSGQNIVEVEVGQILNSIKLSESLVCLRLLFCRYKTNIPVVMSFLPVFQKLKRLRIWFENCYMAIPVQFELNSLSLPALKSVDLSYIVLPINTSDGLCSFPQVNSLALEVYENDIDMGNRFERFHAFTNEPNQSSLQPYQEHFEKLLQIFPAVTKICVQNTGKMKKGEWGVKYVLNGIVKSTGAEKITKIMLKDCAHNFLGDILHLTHNPPHLVLSNVLGNHSGVSTIRKPFQILTGCTETQISEGEEAGSGGQRSTVIRWIGPEVEHCQNKLKNVRKVVLLRNYKSTQVGLFETMQRSGKNEKKIHMDVMVQHLPCLKVLDISTHYFGTDVRNRKKLVEEILAKFPHLVINLI